MTPTIPRATSRNLWGKYGLTERDDTTGLDHTWWRKYENLSGRWSTPDPYNGSMTTADPKSLNRYTYVQNDPVNFIDPSGLFMIVCYYTLVGWSDELGPEFNEYEVRCITIGDVGTPAPYRPVVGEGGVGGGGGPQGPELSKLFGMNQVEFATVKENKNSG